MPHILFSSTAATYGVPEVSPVTEDSPKRPINPYGWSKLMTEQMLADAAAAHGFNYGALRYFNVAGADPAGRSGQSTAGATHLIKVACEAALGKRDSVAVFGTDYDTPDGSCVRDYIHVSDLVAAHVKALERLIERPDENLVLNLGYGRGLSVLEVLDALDRLLPEPIRREMKGRRAGDPGMLISSNEALKRTLEDAYGYVRVRGEISGFKKHGSGHCYFALKDDAACLDAVCWRSTALRLSFRPQDGLEVVATGRITTFPSRSKYQLVVDRLAPAGIGALMALLEQRKKQLAAEGLFDVARKQRLPFLPEVIGIVVDRIGYGPAGVTAVTMPRVVGAALGVEQPAVVAQRHA